MGRGRNHSTGVLSPPLLITKLSSRNSLRGSFWFLFLVGEELMLIEDDGRVVQFTGVMCVYIYSGG